MIDVFCGWYGCGWTVAGSATVTYESTAVERGCPD